MSETATPKLSDAARTVLRLVLERKQVQGGELLSSASFTMPEDLIGPIGELLSAGLLEAEGLDGELNADTVLFGMFGTKPSLGPYLRDLVKW